MPQSVNSFSRSFWHLIQVLLLINQRNICALSKAHDESTQTKGSALNRSGPLLHEDNHHISEEHTSNEHDPSHRHSPHESHSGSSEHTIFAVLDEDHLNDTRIEHRLSEELETAMGSNHPPDEHEPHYRHRRYKRAEPSLSQSSNGESTQLVSDEQQLPQPPIIVPPDPPNAFKFSFLPAQAADETANSLSANNSAADAEDSSVLVDGSRRVHKLVLANRDLADDSDDELNADEEEDEAAESTEISGSEELTEEDEADMESESAEQEEVVPVIPAALFVSSVGNESAVQHDKNEEQSLGENI